MGAYVRTARYTGPCCLCGAMIVAGQPIDFVTRGRARVAAHPACRAAEDAKRQREATTLRTVMGDRPLAGPSRYVLKRGDG
jgi:hypothetical protein